MEFKESKDKLIIELTPPKKTGAKVVLYIQMAIFVGVIVTLFVRLFLNMRSDSILAIVFLLGLFWGIMLIGKKFFGTVFHREIIEVTPTQLTIIDDYLFSKKVDSVSLSKISNVEFIGEEQFTRHPLEGESIDYTGLGVRERIVQSVIADGSIGIFHNGITRRVGKNLPSWDAEVVIDRIIKYTGNRFSSIDEMQAILDDFEKNNSVR